MASSKSNGIEPSDWARAPVRSGPLWLSCLKVVYNPEDKSFLGRTSKRWGIMLVFYSVFYAVLAALFACCMGGLYLSLDKNKPTYTLENSLIGVNPGVAYRPLPTDGVVVKYERSNSSHYDTYTNQLEDFLQPYESENRAECVRNDSYGYPDSPCFYIKVNKIYGWQADCYEKGSLPGDMPQDLVDFINGEEPGNVKYIWVSCEEEKGNTSVLEYPWGRGLPAHTFLSQPDFKSPVVAVRVTPTANKLTTIRCRVWARNIIYNKSLKEGTGYTRIQLHVEDNTAESVE